MKKAAAFFLCALLAAGAFAQDAMAFLAEIKPWRTSRSEQLTEEDVLELFRTARNAPAQRVTKNNYEWIEVRDISDIQILNPITMQKESGYKAVEFPYGTDRYFVFVKNHDLMRRIDAMLKIGKMDLVDRLDMDEKRNPEIAEVLWTNGEMYRVTWVE